MGKRVLCIYCGILLLFTGLLYRLFDLSRRGTLAQAAELQSSSLLEIGRTRGKIYDCNLSPLVGTETSLKAAVRPSPESMELLLRTASTDTEAAQILDRMETDRPFVWLVGKEGLYGRDIDLFEVVNRYEENPPAAHILGYLNGTGKGVTGIERAFDKELLQWGGTLSARYQLNGSGGNIPGTPPEKINQNYNSPAGVILTLDRDIQELAEQAAEGAFDRGAVVVMDVNTGELRALVSRPDFDPRHVEEALGDPKGPLLNRVLCSYSVGSTFKILVAAAAVEQGLQTHTQECTGVLTVDGIPFHCHNRMGHGLMDLRSAMEHSCNPYFISLIQKTGAPSVAYKASVLGFGRSAQLAPGLVTASGTLPTFSELELPGAAANFGFGQGKLSATPIQIAQLISAAANGGYAVQPKLIHGFTQDGQTISEYTLTHAPNRVFSPKAAQVVSDCMISVVEHGSGKKAKPYALGAGGKTASAQTGRYDAEGKELIHAWFAGFYPAQQPRYAIVVLAEDLGSGGDVAAPVFRKICNGILAQDKL